jgi:hypothetical protein
MLQINSQMQVIANKSTDRDYAWSLVALASYAVYANSGDGYIQFYSTGDAALIFNKPIAYIGVAAGGKDRSGIYCNAAISTAYSAADGSLRVTVDLNTSYQVTNWYQSNSSSSSSAPAEPYAITSTDFTCPYGSRLCGNPCPGVLRYNKRLKFCGNACHYEVRKRT